MHIYISTNMSKYYDSSTTHKQPFSNQTATILAHQDVDFSPHSQRHDPLHHVESRGLFQFPTSPV
jgi:hypothetical protein